MEMTSVPHCMRMYPHIVLTAWKLTIILYSATCIAMPGSRAAMVNMPRMKVLPGKRKRLNA